MKFPILKAPIVMNLFVIIVSAVVSFITLTIGIAHIFGEGNPDIPMAEQLLGVAVVAMLCAIGLVFLLLIIAAIKGIFHKLQEKKS